MNFTFPTSFSSVNPLPETNEIIWRALPHRNTHIYTGVYVIMENFKTTYNKKKYGKVIYLRNYQNNFKNLKNLSRRSLVLR